MAKTCQYWGKNKQTLDAHYDDQDDDDDDTNHFITSITSNQKLGPKFHVPSTEKIFEKNALNTR